MRKTVEMTINGRKESFFIGHDVNRWEVPDEETLSQTLRKRLHARISKIDISKAEAYPGVHAVLYHGNMADYIYRPFNDFPAFQAVIDESHPNVSRFKAIAESAYSVAIPLLRNIATILPGWSLLVLPLSESGGRKA